MDAKRDDNVQLRVRSSETPGDARPITHRCTVSVAMCKNRRVWLLQGTLIVVPIKGLGESLSADDMTLRWVALSTAEYVFDSAWKLCILCFLAVIRELGILMLAYIRVRMTSPYGMCGVVSSTVYIAFPLPQWSLDMHKQYGFGDMRKLHIGSVFRIMWSAPFGIHPTHVTTCTWGKQVTWGRASIVVSVDAVFNSANDSIFNVSPVLDYKTNVLHVLFNRQPAMYVANDLHARLPRQCCVF